MQMDAPYVEFDVMEVAVETDDGALSYMDVASAERMSMRRIEPR